MRLKKGQIPAQNFTCIADQIGIHIIVVSTYENNNLKLTMIATTTVVLISWFTSLCFKLIRVKKTTTHNNKLKRVNYQFPYVCSFCSGKPILRCLIWLECVCWSPSELWTKNLLCHDFSYNSSCNVVFFSSVLYHLKQLRSRVRI